MRLIANGLSITWLIMNVRMSECAQISVLRHTTGENERPENEHARAKTEDERIRKR